jgi:hypothetical protein
VSRIPFIVVEEHHEAFYVWQHGIARGWLPPERNTLLHVDEHSDLSLPHLRTPFRPGSGSEEAERFTYDELDIGNFIWPAVYAGVFNRVLWMRYRHQASAGKWRSMSICAKCRPPTRFITATSFASTPFAGAADIRTMEYAPITTEDQIRTDQPIVLDIDLDYFCSNDYPDYGDRELEVTQAAYQRFVDNRYHFLKIAPGSKVTASERGGRYYLAFNDDRAEAGPATDSEAVREEIQARIRGLLEFLGRFDVQPAMIVACKSLHSGYTPRGYASFIEEQLRRALETLYVLDSTHISELLPAADEGLACASSTQNQ